MASNYAQAFRLDSARGVGLARIALGHVEQEYPNHIMHHLKSDGDIAGPRALHPIFFGSYDWHSCVHSYWLLARVANRFPQCDAAADIKALFARRITPSAVAAELRYFQAANHGPFERPYGWAWLLKLAAELGGSADAEPQEYAAVLAPLAEHIVQGFHKYWPLLTYPIRTGTHFNSAFAGVLALDYARWRGDMALEATLTAGARRWFGNDRACQAWEPAGDEFLSPTLMEAVYMSCCLPARAFADWFDAFLPQLAQRQPATLFAPVFVSDRSDGKIAHLDGLNLSRAWCWRRLSRQLEMGDGLEAVASAHLDAAMSHLDSDYMGAHWLATFALLVLEA